MSKCIALYPYRNMAARGVQVTAFTAHQIANLTAEQLAALPAELMAALTPDALVRAWTLLLPPNWDLRECYGCLHDSKPDFTNAYVIEITYAVSTASAPHPLQPWLQIVPPFERTVIR